MGAQMVREVASKTNDIAGDGTTTATVLAQAIVREGMKSVAAGMNPMDLKRGIDLAVTKVVDDLKTRSKPVAGSNEISQVGSIAANGDTIEIDQVHPVLILRSGDRRATLTRTAPSAAPTAAPRLSSQPVQLDAKL